MNFLVVIILFGAMLAGLLVAFFTIRPRREAPPRRAFAVIPLNDGPGRYHIRGVKRETEEELDETIEAETLANAMAKAEVRGIVVTEIEKISG